MKTNNPMFDPEIAASTSDRPFGRVSRLEQFVAGIIAKRKLPFIHNKGKIQIKGRVPDFVFEEKKLVVEVTHPTFYDREKSGYAQKNYSHYLKNGWKCLTIFVRDFSVKTARNVALSLFEFAYNGKRISRILPVMEKLRVYNITTENHTFFAEDLLTHNCDTTEVWKTGEWFDLDEVDAIFRSNGYYQRIKKGAHLVITGGDPLIQQENLVKLFHRMEEFDQQVLRMFLEVETEGVLQPIPEFVKYIRQWNVSPKLSNSGMSKEKRYKPVVLNWHVGKNSCFKFPVRTREDLNEVDDIVRNVRIPRARVYLMPICSTREECLKVSLEVVEFCKWSGYHYSPRLQLLLYDRATGV